MAVTKRRSRTEVDQLLAQRVELLGESRVQEAEEKLSDLAGSAPPEIHLIGQLQKNKVARALRLFDVIHSVGSVALFRRIDRLVAEAGRPPQRVLLQVNTSAEESKGGASPEVLPRLLEAAQDLSNVRILGLMTMAAGGDLAGDPDSARRSFSTLRNLAESHAEGFADPAAVELSMGMSQDFEVAIAEGATLVRIGSALFDDR